ncbi:hypothetical protein PO909_023627 [Leuciscus waleckii]
MRGLEHLTFEEFVNSLDRQGNPPAKEVAVSPEVAVKAAVPPEMAVIASASPEAVIPTLPRKRRMRKAPVAPLNSAVQEDPTSGVSSPGGTRLRGFQVWWSGRTQLWGSEVWWSPVMPPVVAKEAAAPPCSRRKASSVPQGLEAMPTLLAPASTTQAPCFAGAAQAPSPAGTTQAPSPAGATQAPCSADATQAPCPVGVAQAPCPAGFAHAAGQA